MHLFGADHVVWLIFRSIPASAMLIQHASNVEKYFFYQFKRLFEQLGSFYATVILMMQFHNVAYHQQPKSEKIFLYTYSCACFAHS